MLLAWRKYFVTANQFPVMYIKLISSFRLQCRERVKAPQYTSKQEETNIERAPKLLRVLRGKKLLMDDESYFKLKCDYLPGNDHIYTSDIHTAPPDVKLIPQGAQISSTAHGVDVHQ
jgi:hypothetical protein